MFISEEDYLKHYGILRRSGRYPWGTGKSQDERNRSFLGYVQELRREGLSDTEIARGSGITTSQMRAALSIARTETKLADIAMAQRLKYEKGYSNVAISKRMGIPEPTVRAYLKPGEADRLKVLDSTSDMLKRQVAEKKFIDVGVGVHHHIPGVSDTKLRNAVAKLQEQGYQVHRVKIKQLGTGKYTDTKVLCPPGTEWKDVAANKDDIRIPTEKSEDGGRSWQAFQTPLNVSSKRISVRYAEQDGDQADGVIYVRPGVKDLSLGKSNYAQVRIAVDGTHYLKGMAIYRDDLPDGVDLVFNTNKKSTGNKLDAMKSLKTDKLTGKVDEDNPFGAVVDQIIDPTTKKVTSAMNIVNEQGDWGEWSKNLSSQMLSKQPTKLAKQQLDKTYANKRAELDEILSYSNPAVRRKLLLSYSDDADSSAVHLKAAALPRQATRVILPLDKLSEKEIYAPGFRNGERVALIRYPHGGIFEIPELTVNNRHVQGNRLIGKQASDAVGINHKVAQKLSGADFDGDTVLVIPNNDGKIKTASALEGLKNFDPQSAFPPYDGMRTMDGGYWNAAKRKIEYREGDKKNSKTKGLEMGKVSNLITDMTIKKASPSEITRAVRHSMVVIDAEKHGLDWKRSERDNGIPALKKKYQGRSDSRSTGAATLISRAGSELHVPDRKPRSASKGGPIDRETGKLVYEETGRTVTDKHGKVKPKTIESTKLAETDDAHTLSSGTVMEKVYADYSNSMKALANEARRELVRTGTTPYSPSAREAYSKEVESLNAKLALALRNAPLERQAQVLANAKVRLKKSANPDMDKDEIRKVERQALNEARIRTGASRKKIVLEGNEWDAIQAGAITNNKLNQILTYADLDQIKTLATPKSRTLMSPSKIARAKAMIRSNADMAEIADALGVSLSTLNASLEGGGE